MNKKLLTIGLPILALVMTTVLGVATVQMGSTISQVADLRENFGRMDERTAANAANLSELKSVAKTGFANAQATLDRMEKSVNRINMRMTRDDTDIKTLLVGMGVHAKDGVKAVMIDQKIYLFPTNAMGNDLLIKAGYPKVAINPAVSGFLPR